MRSSAADVEAAMPARDKEILERYQQVECQVTSTKWAWETWRGSRWSMLWGFLKREGIKETLRRTVQEVVLWSSKKLLALAAHLSYSPRLVLGEHERQLVRTNRTLKGAHRGRRCFLILNGPSLNRQDLSLLAREITFVANTFWKHPVLDLWQPAYYCIADPYFFDGSAASRQFFVDLRGRAPAAKYIVPLYAKDEIERNTQLPASQVHYVSMKGSLNRMPRFPDLAEIIPTPVNVAQVQIMAAMYMGCSPIYLLGCDHDWLAQPHDTTHFFQGPSIDGHASNDSWGNLSYKSQIYHALTLWTGYEALLGLASKAGIEIYNATHGGYLDVFPRVRYESLFGRSAETRE